MTIKGIKEQFELSDEIIRQIADEFSRAMEAGLRRENSPLLMIPSYIGKPTGIENGQYLAVDMGGTNLRVGRYRIRQREIIKESEVGVPLRDLDRGYDYTTSETNGEALFDFVARQVRKVALSNELLALGHTFSFSTEQKDINDAVLLSWSKEINVSGVEGRNPNELLAEALNSKKMEVTPSVLINDTVGTLLVAAMKDPNAKIGSIVGTGYNSCYLEPKHPLTGEPMIVNMEAANFDWSIPFTKFDHELDEDSQKPGQDRLEKMVSGAYLGELLRLVLIDLVDSEQLLRQNTNKAVIKQKNAIDSKLMAEFIQEQRKIVEFFTCSELEAVSIQVLARVIVMRAARIVAATYIGTIQYLDPELQKKHSIGIDGSVYEKMPGFKEEILSTMIDIMKISKNNIQLNLVKDGSGAGAAIAAAMVDEK